MNRRVALTLVTVLLGAGLAGCSDQPAVCDSVDALQASVDNLRDINVSANGMGAISDSLATIKRDLNQVKTDAEAEYATQVDAVDAAVSELTSGVTAAQQDPSASNLGVVGQAVSGAVDSVAALADDVSSTC
jgi:hypothetical protein